MASVDSMTFNAGSGGTAGVYSPDDPIELTVGYTPDSPSVVPQTFTATTTISDASGNALGSNSAPFTVNESQPAGDTLATTDDGGRTWAEASDTGSVAVFTTTA
jgi:hypothetical protein